MRGRAKPRWIPYLVYGIIVAMLVSTVTLSRYMSTVSGTGAVSVASVALDGSIPIDVKNMVPGEGRTVTFSVTNEKDGQISDVAQSYTVTVSTTGNLPLHFTLSAAASPSTGYALTRIGQTDVWTGGALPHTTDTTHTYTLTVTWPANETDPKYAREVDAVTLTVDAQQAD